ncbi:MAG: S41 family peptidase, partial [Clostridia bacterium]|nr:S41 family peptidase [Clostridia bacterium]
NNNFEEELLPPEDEFNKDDKDDKDDKDGDTKKLYRIFTALTLTLSLLLGVFIGVCTSRYVFMKNEENTIRFPAVNNDGANYSIGEDLKLFYEVYSLISQKYAGEIDPEKMMEYAISAYVYGLNDPYSTYMTKNDADTFIDGDYGKKAGIGIKVYRTDEPFGMYIYSVIKDAPAEKAGLKVGDYVIAVDGKEVNKDSYYQCVDDVKGDAGTTVTITVKRGDEILEIPVVRGNFVTRSVEYRLLNSGDKIGYVRIMSLATDTAKEFKNAIEDLKSLGATSYIFDVRDDGGGYLSTIIEVLDMLLPEGPIIRYTDAYGKETVDSSDDKVIVEAPMAVLINKNTASAAELFSAALKDYELAVLVGETTYGKGVMQTLFTLSNGDTLKLTTSQYSPPYSDNYNGIGVKPDIEVKLTGDKPFYLLSAEEDEQLQAAVDALEGMQD